MKTALAIIPRTYAELRREVERVLFRGRRDIESAWVRTYHEIGRLIQEHLLLKQARASYGARTYQQLAAHTKVSRRVLYECAQFYRCFPIVRPAAQLTWTHYQLLCQVDDVKQRAALVAEVTRKGLPTIELKTRVRSLNTTLELAAGPSARLEPELLTARRGIPERFRVVPQDAALCVDLGFKLYLPLSPAQARYRTADEIVAVASDGTIRRADEARPSDLYTYRASVRRVIDGDTLEIAVALPHVTLREKLRLRGLDCPELDTAEGQAARLAVEALVRSATAVTIYTTKPDKYDRYLADVYFAMGDGAEVYLNNHLLTQGLAERKDAWDFSDWEKKSAI